MFKNFKDGSTAEVDVIMMCTGYLHSYPFLRFKFCFCETWFDILSILLQGGAEDEVQEPVLPTGALQGN